MKTSFLRRWLGIAGIFTTIYFIIIGLVVYRFSLQDDTQPADAAVVLGAAVFRDRPSPVLRERLNHAIALYEQGEVKFIIFTGGLGVRDRLTEAEVGKRYALAQGVPASAILLEDQSISTLGNLAGAKTIGKSNGLHSYLIVSTPFHMKRAMSLANRLQMEAYTSPTRSTKWSHIFSKTRAFIREVLAYGIYLIAV